MTRAIAVMTLVLLGAVSSPAFAVSFGEQIDEKIRINGYFSFEYEKQISDDGAGDPNGSFDADLIDLVINAFPMDRLRLSTDLSWEHGTATEEDFGNVAVEYAFGEYTVKDWFQVRAGKMLTAFGIYNEVHTAKPVTLTVKEPLSTNKNNKIGSDLRFYPRWGTGLAFLGNSSISGVDVDYIVQVTNGAQENTNPFEEDDNSEKAFAGRVRLMPADSLTVGFSLYYDSLTELDEAEEETGGRTELFSYGAQAEWEKGGFGLQLEYVGGYVEPSSGGKNTRNAMTAMISYTFKDRYTPYLRYEYLDPSTDIDDDEASLFVYGINTRVGDALFLKLELDTIDAGVNNTDFDEGENKYTELKAAAVFAF